MSSGALFLILTTSKELSDLENSVPTGLAFPFPLTLPVVVYLVLTVEVAL